MASILDYTTYKYVTLRDKRLGITYYIFVILIIAYILQDVIIDKGYLKFDTNLHGTIQLLVKDPDVEAPLSSLPYCPEYSAENLQSNIIVYNRTVPCIDYDAMELSWPVESNYINIMSFGKDRWQTRQKSSSGAYVFDSTEENTYFARNPESTIIKIEHSISSTLLKKGKPISASHRSMKGILQDSRGNIVKAMNNHDKPDKLKLSELINAAGIKSLDEHSDAIGITNESYRMRGLVIRISLYYSNHENTLFGLSDIHYTYRVQHVPYVDFQSKQIIPVLKQENFEAGVVSKFHTNQRLLRKRYSIRVEFQQEGSLGVFSFNAFLYQLIAGTSLLTLLATVIDVIALNLIPRYCQYMMDYSPQIIKNGDKQKATAGDSSHTDKDDTLSECNTTDDNANLLPNIVTTPLSENKKDK